MAKLTLNGVSHVYQTCQADVKTCHLKAKNASYNMARRRKLSIMYVKPARATAKLKLNGVSQVCQTCQADVNMQPAGQKCQPKKGRETNGVSHAYQTCQADLKTCHLKAKNAQLKHSRETSAI